MSIEVKLAELTAAIKENTATLLALSSKTAAVKSSAPSEAKKSPPKEAPEEEKPRGRGRPPKAKTLTPTEMAEKGREFCENAGDDEEEFKARRALTRELAAKYDVTKFSEIKGDDQAKALAALEAYLAGDGDGDGDDEGDY